MPKRKTAPEPRQAEHGEKTIELSVRFWTNDIADQEGKILPNQCRSSGALKLAPNDAHGIAKNQRWVPFNSLPDLLAKLETLLIKQGVTMHLSRKELQRHCLPQPAS